MRDPRILEKEIVMKDRRVLAIEELLVKIQNGKVILYEVTDELPMIMTEDDNRKNIFKIEYLELEGNTSSNKMSDEVVSVPDELSNPILEQMEQIQKQIQEEQLIRGGYVKLTPSFKNDGNNVKFDIETPEMSGYTYRGNEITKKQEELLKCEGFILKEGNDVKC